VKIASTFRANPGPQSAFYGCRARIVGYGGAMGGGKSRAFCERALDYALECPGVEIVIARQKHTAIVETTRKTMMDEVLDPRLIAHRKASLGEDYVRLLNGSTIHFIGLDDPVRWFSAQIGVFMVDQAEECDEDTIVKLITRLRHPKAPLGVNPPTAGYGDRADAPVAGKCYLSFNPENPGHWLQRWFLTGAVRTRYGFRKPELYATDALKPLGDAEFFFAKATDNPHLPPGYVEQTLEGLPEHLRRRYLEGVWEFISGTCYFDTEALGEYQQAALETKPVLSGFTEGDVLADAKAVRRGEKPEEPVKFRAGNGPWTVWKRPRRGGLRDDGSREPAHRYVLSVDVSSGGSTDYSGIQVISVEDFEQVAEYQGKADPDLIAVEAYRAGRIYNDALIVPEVTGGWGFSVEQELKRLGYRRLYTKKVLDRLTRKWTDRTGWDTTVKTRAHMLDTLERVIRERELAIHSLRAINELGTFVRDDAGRPAAQPGCNDDLVIALAIGVTVAADMPRELRRMKREPYRPHVSAVTGY
jgi:terminase large subunit-like protein